MSFLKKYKLARAGSELGVFDVSVISEGLKSGRFAWTDTPCKPSNPRLELILGLLRSPRPLFRRRPCRCRSHLLLGVLPVG